jgi:hypothetical protein
MAALLCIRPGGARIWWAHLAFTRINITPTILRKEIEELREVRVSAPLRSGSWHLIQS